jgi:lactose/L-arabinose transport system substrate-binding protein
MKTKLVLGTLLAGTMLLSACGNGSGSSSDASGSASAAASGKTKITVMSWNQAADALTAEIAGFNKKYPDIEVEVLKDSGSYTKVVPSLASGSGAPDIIQTEARDFPAFMKKFPDAFVDITDKTTPLKSQFIESAWGPVTFDSKVYAMPWDLGPSALYYRKDLFEQAGIDANSLKTWDEFIKAGKQLQEKVSGTKMTAYGNDYEMYNILFNQLGGNYMSGGKLDIQSAASKQALSMQKKFLDEGLLMNIKDWNGRITAVTNNKVATLIYPVWYAGTLQSAMKDQAGKWGVMPLPAFEAGGNSQANLGGSVLAVTKQSKNADAAWKFIEYSLATNEGEEVMLKNGLFPSYVPFYDQESFKQNNEYFGTPLYTFFAEQTKGIPAMEYGPIFLDAEKPLTDMVSSVLSGTSVDDAAKAAADAISKSTGIESN